MATARSGDPSASLIGDLRALGKSQRSKVVVLALVALVGIALATRRVVDPGPEGKPEHPGRALLLLDRADSEAAELIRAAGFEIERSSLVDATARARQELGDELDDDVSDIDAIARWADSQGIGFLLLRHRVPEGVTSSEDPQLKVALEALAHVQEQGDAARYLAIPVGDLRQLGAPTVAPRRREWLDNEGVEALEALLEQPIVRGEVQLDSMHPFAAELRGRFTSGFSAQDRLVQLEASFDALHRRMSQRWSDNQAARDELVAGRYTALQGGWVDSFVRVGLRAKQLDALEVYRDETVEFRLGGALEGCETLAPARSWLEPLARSPDAALLLLRDEHGAIQLARSSSTHGVTLGEGLPRPDAAACGWTLEALGPSKAIDFSTLALHRSGRFVARAADAPVGAAPLVGQLGSGSAMAIFDDIKWPAELAFGPARWVDWPEPTDELPAAVQAGQAVQTGQAGRAGEAGESEPPPILVVAAGPRAGGPYSYLLLWHPSFGVDVYQAGLKTIGLRGNFDDVHTRPGHEAEFLVSSRRSGGSLFRMVIPVEAISARLGLVQQLGTARRSHDDRAAAAAERAIAALEACPSWLRSTLVREEPFDELLIDDEGLRVALLTRLPTRQSLRVLAIEEAKGVELEVPDADISNLVFGAGGDELYSHFEVIDPQAHANAEQEEALAAIRTLPRDLLVPRRHALPSALIADKLRTREALLRTKLGEGNSSGAPTDNSKSRRGGKARSVKEPDPDAAREIQPD